MAFYYSCPVGEVRNFVKLLLYRRPLGGYGNKKFNEHQIVR